MKEAASATTKNADNASENASRATRSKASTARCMRAKEQSPEPSATESEIYPSHKSEI